MFPGFFLAFLYLIYIIGWALIDPKIAPRLPEEQTRVPVPDWVGKFQAAYSRNLLVGSLPRCSRRAGPPPSTPRASPWATARCS